MNIILKLISLLIIMTISNITQANVEISKYTTKNGIKVLYSKSENIILLHTNTETGHSGASGRFEALKEVAMEYAFLIGLEKNIF